MRVRLAAFLAATTLPLLAGPVVAVSPADAAPVTLRATCTHTSSGSCIRGGQFCPQSSYGRVGIDAVGRRYTCRGDRVHPHWMK